MGFDRELSEKALKLSKNDIEIAITLLLNGNINHDNDNNNNNDNDNDISQNIFNKTIRKNLKPVKNEKVASLMMMGFDQKTCENALKQANDNIEEAADILINNTENNEDLLNKQQTNGNTKKNSNEIENMIDNLMSMGFLREDCERVLNKNNNDFEKSLNELLAEIEIKNQDLINQVDPNIFGDLKNVYLELTSLEKAAVSRLLSYGEAYDVIQIYISCDKNEEAAKKCFI